MNDRYRSRKLNRYQELEDWGQRNEECTDEGGNKDTRIVRKAYKGKVYLDLAGSRVAKLSLFVIHVVLLFAVRLLFRERILREKLYTHTPPTWANGWNVSHVLADSHDRDQKDYVSGVCSDRKIVSPRGMSSLMEGEISWTIAMTINVGFLEFFQNWYSQFQKLGLKMDMVLFAEDPAAYDLLSNARFLDKTYTMIINATNMTSPRKFKKAQSESSESSSTSSSTSSTSTDDESASTDDESADDSTSPEKSQVFDAHSHRYKELISNRPTRLLQVLCSGRNVLYIDTDTVLRKNPLPLINMFHSKGVDISIAIDNMKSKKYKHGWGVCTGFVAIKANPNTVHFVSEWERRCHEDDGDANNDQTAFNRAYESVWLRKEMDDQEYIAGGFKNNAMVELQGLPVALFPNGHQYFKEYNETQRKQVVLVHANWIVGGDKKKHILKKFGMWETES